MSEQSRCHAGTSANEGTCWIGGSYNRQQASLTLIDKSTATSTALSSMDPHSRTTERFEAAYLLTYGHLNQTSIPHDREPVAEVRAKHRGETTNESFPVDDDPPHNTGDVCHDAEAGL